MNYSPNQTGQQNSHTQAFQFDLSERQKKIIKFLFYNNTTTLREVSKLLNVSHPTASRLVEALQSRGFVQVHTESRSSGGRRSIQYQLNPDAGYIICVDAGRLNTKLAILNMNQEVVASRHFRSRVFSQDNGFLSALSQNIKDIKAEVGIPDQKYLGMGVGIPGFVNTDLGTSYSFLNYYDKPIRDVLEETFNLPVVLSNDVNMMAHAEHHFGAAKDHNDALILNLGWGIGLGLVLNNSVYLGTDGFAGEIGHIQVKEDGEQCHCGKYGCLETLASGEAIAKEAVRRIGAGEKSLIDHETNDKLKKITGRVVVAAAQQGDEFSIKLLHDSGTLIGKALAMIVQILNPEVIILGGKLSRAGKLLTNSIQQSLIRYTNPQIAEHVVINISSLDENSNFLGAAGLVVEKIICLEEV